MSSAPQKPLLNEGRRSKWTTVQWLVCTIAAIGFAFDIYELLMLPLIARPAILELGGYAPGTPEFANWVGRLFYIPAIAGGIFGLLGGYMTDLFGRRRVLTGSILLYAFAAFAAGYSTSLNMLLFFRCLVFIGVCVEFVAAVAWLAELFDDPEEREGALGFTQAFSSVGGLGVAIANSIAIGWAINQQPELFYGIKLPALQLPTIHLPEWLDVFGTSILKERTSHSPWRYTLMSGLIPAIPLIIIRPFLPESPKWAARREAGTLKRPSIAQLFAPELRRTTIVTTIMFMCSFGAAFGAIQQIPQIVPALPQTKEAVAKAVEAKANELGKSVEELSERERRTAVGPAEQKVAAHVTKVQEVGGLVGRFLLAVLAIYIISRRSLIRIFLIPGLILMPIVFGYAAVTDLHMLEFGIFAAGLLTVAQFSFWGNYLPGVYPLHLRGTGESFAANIGGRLLGTSFAWVTQRIAASGLIPGESPAMKIAYTAAGVAFAVYLVNLLLTFVLPEPKREDLSH